MRIERYRWDEFRRGRDPNRGRNQRRGFRKGAVACAVFDGDCAGNYNSRGQEDACIWEILGRKYRRRDFIFDLGDGAGSTREGGGAGGAGGGWCRRGTVGGVTGDVVALGHSVGTVGGWGGTTVC